jgi:superfamily II DNA helicase RecQ
MAHALKTHVSHGFRAKVVNGAVPSTFPAADPAKEHGAPPDVIFHDATLREMAAIKPHDRPAWSEISGIGARKLDAYGDAFLTVIRTF